MTPFDVECPRCKRLTEEAEKAPSPPLAVTPAPVTPTATAMPLAPDVPPEQPPCVLCPGLAEWLAGRIGEGDMASCKRLFAGWAEEDLVTHIVSLDFGSDLPSITRHEDHLLRGCLLLLVFNRGFGTGGEILGDEPEFLAKTATPMSVSFPRMPEYLDVVNPFIRKMRREYEYSEVIQDMRPLKAGQLWALPPLDWDGIGPIRARLGRASVAARQHFFDILARRRGATGTAAFSAVGATFYKTRQLGIQAAETAKELASLGLISRADAAAVAQGITKPEIVGILEAAGVSASKSWKKDRLVEAVCSKASDAAIAFGEERGLASVPDWVLLAEEDLKALVEFYARQFGVMLSFLSLKWRR